MRVRDMDMSGQKIGRLTVLRAAGVRGDKRRWECVCDCGKTHTASTSDLRRRQVKSCGCLRNDTRPALSHGHTNTPTYSSWRAMKQRCAGQGNDGDRYLARGITYPREWSVFENFLRDMGERPPGTTLDRVDNAAGYSKDNCRWATHKEQTRNRSSNKLIEWHGEVMPLVVLAERVARVSCDILSQRLRAGWDLERALFTPINQSFSHSPRRLGERT